MHHTEDQIDLVLPSLRATGRKQILKDLAKEIGRKMGLRQQIIYDRLQQQTTPPECSMGAGVMIADITLSAAEKPLNVLARLSGAYDFSSPDGEPTDLIMVVISPEKEGIAHLQRLAGWSRRMRDETLLDSLRRAEDSEDIYLALAAQNRPQKQAA